MIERRNSASSQVWGLFCFVSGGVCKMPSRMQSLSLALSVIFVLLLAHSIKLSHDRAKVYKKLRDQFDTNGDKKLGKEEVAKWFSKYAMKKGGNGDAKRFEDMLALFDIDGDGVFDDEELGDMMDFADEVTSTNVLFLWPTQT
jgi:hypothetical protein